jgi:hypothetical protein
MCARGSQHSSNISTQEIFRLVWIQDSPFSSLGKSFNRNLTLELTRAEHEAFNTIPKNNDESHATEASG